MTSQDIIERLKRHTDPQGHYMSGTWQDGNTVLFTSELIAFSNSLSTEIKQGLEQKLLTLEKEPGLLIRHPLISDHEGPDNAIGRITSSPDYAARYLRFARTHGYVFNNHEDKYRLGQDFSRFMQVTAHAQWQVAERERPCELARFAWYVSLYVAGLTLNNSNRCLGLHLATVGLEKGYDREKRLSEWFFSRCYKLGFSTYGQVRAHYHQDPTNHDVLWFCDKALPRP